MDARPGENDSLVRCRADHRQDKKGHPLRRVSAYAEYTSRAARRVFATRDGACGTAQTLLKRGARNRHSLFRPSRGLSSDAHWVHLEPIQEAVESRMACSGIPCEFSGFTFARAASLYRGSSFRRTTCGGNFGRRKARPRDARNRRCIAFESMSRLSSATGRKRNAAGLPAETLNHGRFGFDF